MMRFPLRLIWDLTKVQIAQELFGLGRRSLVLRLNLADLPVQGEINTAGGDATSSANSSRDLQALALVRESAPPFVWIGGDTPLHYPRIGQITRAVINQGRTVFIEVDGTLLRRRVHEFRPVSHLYLVLPLNGLETAHDSRAARAGNFRATMESIRTAKLSGFHVCVETTIFADMEMSELRGLAEFISRMDIDGWIQRRPAGLDQMQISDEEIKAARALIPSTRWRIFSEQLDLALSSGSLRKQRENEVKQIDGKVPAREEGLGAL
jgi:hypothetical protein